MHGEGTEISATHLQALLDVLTHYEAYTELSDLKMSDNVKQFGHPLQDDDRTMQSSSPLLKLLVRDFVRGLPGLADIEASFWTQNVPDLMIALADSNLSESRDKGAVGIRKMLSTAIASLIEGVARGMLGGFFVQPAQASQDYDLSNSQDLEAAWNEFLRQLIYGDMTAHLIMKIAETQELSQHSILVQAAHRYVLLMLSSFLHYTLIVSPRGQTMLPLLNKAHDLLPYYLIRQTLKIGNVASMLNAMTRLILAKMSMSNIAGWFGYTAPSESGMSLLQYIISTVLNSDMGVFKKQNIKIEQGYPTISAEQFGALRAYGMMSKDQQQDIRARCTAGNDLIGAIWIEAGFEVPSDEQHHACLAYLANQLSVIDREKLTAILCQHNPDLLSSTIRTMVKAYEPVIRELHKAVDLSGSVLDFQSFLTDLIKLAKIEPTAKQMPSVENFFSLLTKHMASSHKFIHQACKNSPQLVSSYSSYGKASIDHYRQQSMQGNLAAGDLSDTLRRLYAQLEPHEQLLIQHELSAHAEELARLSVLSSSRMDELVQSISIGESKCQMGPGIYIEKWQQLMDRTQVTHSSVENVRRDRQPFSLCPNTIRLLGTGFKEYINTISRG